VTVRTQDGVDLLGRPGLRTRRERCQRSARRTDRPLDFCDHQRVTPAALLAGPARVHHIPAAGFAAIAVALLLTLPALLGDVGRLAAVLVLQLGLVLAWVLATGIQGFAGSLAVGAAAAVAADLVLVLPSNPALGGLLAVLGVGFLAVVLQQMLRRPRHELVASLSGGVLLLCIVSALAALLLLGRERTGDGDALVALLAVGAALLVGHLVDLVLPRPRLAADVPRGLPGLLLAVLAGAAVGYLGRGLGHQLDPLPALVSGAVLGLVAALTALAASYIVVEAMAEAMTGDRARDDHGDDAATSPWVLGAIQAVLPLAACAPVAVALQSAL
jgi:hypothetical protein